MERERETESDREGKRAVLFVVMSASHLQLLHLLSQCWALFINWCMWQQSRVASPVSLCKPPFPIMGQGHHAGWKQTFLYFVTQQEDLVPSFAAARVAVDSADLQFCCVWSPWTKETYSWRSKKNENGLWLWLLSPIFGKEENVCPFFLSFFLNQ